MALSATIPGTNGVKREGGDIIFYVSWYDTWTGAPTSLLPSYFVHRMKYIDSDTSQSYQTGSNYKKSDGTLASYLKPLVQTADTALQNQVNQQTTDVTNTTTAQTNYGGLTIA